jgi:hypothetical protein
MLTFQDLFARVLFPQRIRCAKAWLVPMTLDHAEALESLGLWVPDGDDALRAAAFICSRPWTKARRVICGPWSRTSLHLWSELKRNWKLTSADFAAWARYVTLSREQAVVTYNTKRKGEAPTGTPWLTHLRVVACSKLGYRPETVGGVELSKLVNEYHAFSEMECAATVIPASRSQFDESARQMQERIKCQS